MGLLALCGVTDAADFRVDSQVVLRGEKQPLSKNATLFYKGSIYNYDYTLQEVTVLEPQNKRFLLLNPAREQQTQVSFAVMSDFIAGVHVEAKKSPSEFIRLLAEPKFEQSFDRETAILSLSNKYMEYQLTSVAPPRRQMAAQWAEFSDWRAQLDTLTNPGGMPPFARLYVNSLLKSSGRIPGEVVLTLRITDGEPVVFRRIHEPRWKLQKADLQTLQQIEQMMQSFPEVPPQTYFRSPQVEAQRPASAPQR